MKESNILIAEFMGGVETEHGYFIPFHCIVNINTIESGYGAVTKYHTSFDWLMPVAICILSAKFCLECDAKCIYPWKDATDLINEIRGAFEKGIEPLYNAVVEFIKWYNEQTA